MKTVKQVSDLTGVSIRALHYYDEIGLLSPTKVTEAGYRLYDQAALDRLGEILTFRELDFSLEQIRTILSHPGYDKKEALKAQKQLLILRQERLSRLIAMIQEPEKGERKMDFQVFDNSAIARKQEQYQDEVEKRWGHTQAYEVSQKKTANYSEADWQKITSEQQELFAAFGELMDREPEDASVQQLVCDWQAHISRYFYPCSVEILAGLGQMYTADERFAATFETVKPGLAAFISQAIRVYVQKKANGD